MLSAEEFRKLQEDTRGVRIHAFAPGTFNNLVLQWVKYFNFCSRFSLPTLPANTTVLAWYAQYILKNLSLMPQYFLLYQA